MPVNVTFIAENGVEVVGQIGQFLGAIQALTNQGAAVAKANAEATTKAEAKTTTVAAKPATKGKGKKEEAESTHTLQDAIDRATNAVGDKDSDGHEARCKQLGKIHTKFGIGKVRELPADKIDAYVAEIDKAFPQEEEESADEEGLF